MTMFRSMSTPLRFVVWFFLALPVTFGVGASGYFIPAGAFKSDLILALQIACNLLLGWLFGLLRFRNGPEIATSVLVVVFSLVMRIIVLFLAIVATLFCGIDACGH